MDSMIYDTMDDHFSDIIPKYDEDSSAIDAYHQFLDWSSRELFSSDSVRPVKSLKPFIKPKFAFVCQTSSMKLHCLSSSFLRKEFIT
jgi:hypothetical protein